MPKIREYEQRTDVAGPIQGRRASADDQGFSGGLQTLGREISNLGEVIQKRQEQNEVSDLNAKMAEAKAKFGVQLDETMRTADPGDATVTENFLKGYDDYVSAIGENISTRAGRNYFNQTNAALRGHFLQSAATAQADLAGLKAKQDFVATSGNYSSSVLSDPASFGFTKELQNEAIQNYVRYGSLSSKDAVELKALADRKLAVSAVQGWININPEFAKKQLESGKWDGELDGLTKDQMMSQANQALRGEQVDQERKRREAERMKAEAQMQTQNTFLEKMAKNELKVQDVLSSNLDPFGSGSKQQFINMLDQENRSGSTMRTDPGTFKDLFERIHTDDSNPRKIRDENDLNYFFGRGLNMESLNQLRAEIQGKRTIDGGIESDLKKGVADIARSTLTRSNPLTGFRDPRGDERYQRFMNYFLKEYSDQRKKGKTPQELLDPDSPGYLGKQISKFAPKGNEVMQDLINGLTPMEAEELEATTQPTPLVPPEVAAENAKAAVGVPTPGPEKPAKPVRLPNESAADYLKRIGK